YEFVYARQEPTKPGPIVLDVIDRHGLQDMNSKALKLTATAARSLCRALRDAARGLSAAQQAPPADQFDSAPAKRR
ncbi:MAG: hypothetical protein K2Y33_20575, partial [Mycolicibacterium frederiksbergense]|nr:hypothetical protein [Mycolicibacterium frederiksbergense]